MTVSSSSSASVGWGVAAAGEIAEIGCSGRIGRGAAAPRGMGVEMGGSGAGLAPGASA